MRNVGAWVVVLLLVVGRSAGADPAMSPEERGAAAKQFFETGMAHFQLEEYDRAVESWESGFRMRPVAQFLYNIGQAHRLAKRYEKALSFYKKYLYMEPKAVNKAEVERHIATLTRLIDDQGKISNAPPTQPLLGTGELGRQPRRTDKPEPVVQKPLKPEPVVQKPEPVVQKPVVQKPEPVVVVAEPKPNLIVTAHVDNRPVTKKPWFWGVIGGVAVVVVAAVVVGVVLGTGGDSTKTLPGVTF